MRKDFHLIKNETQLILYPNKDNPLHTGPIKAIHRDGYYYCENSNPHEGPDYYFRDVAIYNEGFVILE